MDGAPMRQPLGEFGGGLPGAVRARVVRDRDPEREREGRFEVCVETADATDRRRTPPAFFSFMPLTIGAASGGSPRPF
jgi:hypothetical protein